MYMSDFLSMPDANNVFTSTRLIKFLNHEIIVKNIRDFLKIGSCDILSVQDRTQVKIDFYVLSLDGMESHNYILVFDDNAELISVSSSLLGDNLDLHKLDEVINKYYVDFFTLAIRKWFSYK